MKRARVLRSKVMFRGPVFGVRRDRVVEPGGIAAMRDVVTHPGSVVVLPRLPDGRIVMVRQYRHAVGCYLWELVAGRVDRSETPLVGARRELLEETGYTARRWRKLMRVFPTPGFVSEWMVVYLADGLRAGQARPEADELIQMRGFGLPHLLRMIHSGTLHDAKSVAAILFLAHSLPKG